MKEFSFCNSSQVAFHALKFVFKNKLEILGSLNTLYLAKIGI